MNYYLHDGTRQSGPFTMEEILLLKNKKNLFIWGAEFKEWTPLDSIIPVEKPSTSISKTTEASNFPDNDSKNSNYLFQRIGFGILFLTILIIAVIYVSPKWFHHIFGSKLEGKYYYTELGNSYSADHYIDFNNQDGSYIQSTNLIPGFGGPVFKLTGKFIVDDKTDKIYLFSTLPGSTDTLSRLNDDLVYQGQLLKKIILQSNTQEIQNSVKNNSDSISPYTNIKKNGSDLASNDINSDETHATIVNPLDDTTTVLKMDMPVIEDQHNLFNKSTDLKFLYILDGKRSEYFPLLSNPNIKIRFEHLLGSRFSGLEMAYKKQVYEGASPTILHLKDNPNEFNIDFFPIGGEFYSQLVINPKKDIINVRLTQRDKNRKDIRSWNFYERDQKTEYSKNWESAVGNDK